MLRRDDRPEDALPEDTLVAAQALGATMAGAGLGVLAGGGGRLALVPLLLGMALQATSMTERRMLAPRPPDQGLASTLGRVLWPLPFALAGLLAARTALAFLAA